MSIKFEFFGQELNFVHFYGCRNRVQFLLTVEEDREGGMLCWQRYLRGLSGMFPRVECGVFVIKNRGALRDSSGIRMIEDN